MQECKELIKKCFSFQVKNLKKLLQKVTKLAAKSPLLPCLPKWPIESMGHQKFMLVAYPSNPCLYPKIIDTKILLICSSLVERAHFAWEELRSK